VGGIYISEDAYLVRKSGSRSIVTRGKIRAGLFIAAGLLASLTVAVTINVANSDDTGGEAALAESMLGDGLHIQPDVDAPAANPEQALPAIDDTLSSNDGSGNSEEPLFMDDEPVTLPKDTMVRDLPYTNKSPGDSSDAIQTSSGSASGAPAPGGVGPAVVTVSELLSEDPTPDFLHIAPNPGYPDDIQR
jgi:hypothetical protein